MAGRATRIGFGVAGSVAVHATVLGAVAFVLSRRAEPPPPVLPVELIAVAEPERPQPSASPTPQPEAPKPTPTPKPRPKPVAKPAPPPEPRAPEPRAPAPEPEERAQEEVETPPEPPTQAVQARAMDLRPYVPGGARLMIVLRTDRLRGTRWAPGLDAVLSPMPDYQTVIAPSGLPLVDTFDTVVIATPDARDVTATFLAAKTGREEAAVKSALTGPTSRPRVVWEPAAGGEVGKPVRDPRSPIQDPRVILVPGGGWMLLTRPDHVAELLAPPAGTQPGAQPGSPPAGAQPAAQPSWMERLGKVVAETGDKDGPILVLGIADIARRVKMLPGAPAAPVRGTVAVHATSEGFILEGTLVFADEASAEAFARSAAERRREAVDGVFSRGMLKAAHALGVVEKLTLTRRGPLLEVRSDLAADDAAVLLEHAATWSREYFESRRY